MEIKKTSQGGQIGASLMDHNFDITRAVFGDFSLMLTDTGTDGQTLL